MKRLTRFLGLEVVDPEGTHLGRVVDLRSRGAPEHGRSREERKVTELVYGKIGLFERLGLLEVDEQRVRWSMVLRLEPDRVVLKRSSG